MKYITILLCIVTLQSCAENIKNQPVAAYLLPVHTLTTGFNEQDYIPVDLIDNDGNMYITYWDIKGVEQVDFNLLVKECRDDIKSNRLFSKAIQVSEMKLTSIVPSLFKQFNSCIQSKHYEHKYSDAFSPDKYKLSITRPISSSGEYMPVGAKYFLTKKGVKYKNVIIDIKECELEINKTESKGIQEVHSAGYSHVSIEDYANNMKTCLRKDSYLFDSDNAEKTNKTVKLKREKDSILDQTNKVLGKLP